MNILAVIPARSGSKSVPHKNIKLMNGKPMLAYSIEHAKQSKRITRVVVSTDSEEYAEIARNYGAEVPFLRPSEYATDTATDFEVFYHLLTELKTREGYEPDIVVQLRPTYPIRDVNDIDAMIDCLLTDSLVDSVRSIAVAKEIPYKMWRKREDGRITPLLSDIQEAYNMPRQELPKVYYQNACIDVIRSYVITELKSMSGNMIVGYEMKENYDIDTKEEWEAAERELVKRSELDRMKKGGLTFVFDIDGVIAKLTPMNDYSKAEPMEKTIAIINQLYHWGNKIVLLTARGYVTGFDWKETTEKQLDNWGLRYHELHFGKPNADYYIDDKMIGLDHLIRLMEVEV